MRIYIIELGNFLDDTTKVKTVFSEQPLDKNDINIFAICEVSENDYFVKYCYVPSIEINAWTEEEYVEGQNLVELITKN